MSYFDTTPLSKEGYDICCKRDIGVYSPPYKIYSLLDISKIPVIEFTDEQYKEIEDMVNEMMEDMKRQNAKWEYERKYGKDLPTGWGISRYQFILSR